MTEKDKLQYKIDLLHLQFEMFPQLYLTPAVFLYLFTIGIYKLACWLDKKNVR